MTRLTHTVIPKQFSDFIREEYPRFIEFVQAYYKFLDSTVSTSKINSIKDIDEVSEQFIANYRKEFAIDIPRFDQLSDRAFIRFSRELYEARGTEDALRFLFRAAFASEIQINYPKDWILKASAGRWYKEWFFDVEVLNVGYGLYNSTYPLSYNVTAGTPFNINVIRYSVLDEDLAGTPTKIRFYTDKKPTDLVSGIHLKQFNENNTIIFFSVLVPSPNKITILEPGLTWKLGQLVKIPADRYNTFARVTSVGINGELTGIEVLEYGYNHKANPSDPDPEYLVSSWPYEPAIGAPERSAWEASRARFLVEYSSYGANKGSWLTEDGHISNTTYRLQDNFFYQNFSYLVKTTANNPEADSIIKINHPAGLKYFKQLELSSGISFDMGVSRSRSLETVYLFDGIDGLVDSLNILLDKVMDDDPYTSNEGLPNLTWVRSRALTDSEGVLDTAQNLSWIRATSQSDTTLVTISDASNVNTTTDTYSESGYADATYVGSELHITLS